jgi:hypothetical protein
MSRRLCGPDPEQGVLHERVNTSRSKSSSVRARPSSVTCIRRIRSEARLVHLAGGGHVPQ